MKTISLALGILLVGLVGTARSEPVLAGNSNLAAQNLDGDAVRAVLLGKRVTLGESRVVIVIAKNSSSQDAFLKTAVAMTTSQFQNHWRRLFMTGGGSAPKIVETEEDACKLVAETPGAIAAVDRAKCTGLAVLAPSK